MNEISRFRSGEAASAHQVGKLFGLTPRAVRYYEERGLVIPSRDHANKRWFDAGARRRLQLIAQLRRCRLSIAEIADILNLKNGSLSSEIDFRQASMALTSRLSEVEEERKQLVAAIRVFAHDCIC
jgi:DNA-binding transcriptional MerR regulator